MNNWCICWFHMHPLNTELNPICHLLALLGGATILVVSRLRVNSSLVIALQELKNKWRSAEELRKTDNGHGEKNSWKQRQKLDGDYEPKCNIQKGNRDTDSFV